MPAGLFHLASFTIFTSKKCTLTDFFGENAYCSIMIDVFIVLCSMSDGLRILRQVQMEVRQMDSASAGGEVDSSTGGGGLGKQGESVAGGIAV